MKQVLVALFCLSSYYAMAQDKPNLTATDRNTDHPNYVKASYPLLEDIVSCMLIRDQKQSRQYAKTYDCSCELGIFRDGEAVAGVEYYYWIEYRTASGNIIISEADKGSRPGGVAVTIPELLGYADLFGSSPEVRLKDSILIAQPKIKGKWKKKKNVKIETIAYNIGYGTIENVKVAYYISNDRLLDDTDQLIDEMPIEDLKGFSSPTDVNGKLKLPKGKYYGKYLIMAVYEAETIKAITYKKIVKE